ncbi:homing endonuclease associated repeat-containing protein [Metabacillus fastidiosus]|uniref:homing endonuclease associated repeat-containing protein n=1 Tax=Metabacillus fastidiosus TaxID=1458 RepID=UPI003D277C14
MATKKYDEDELLNILREASKLSENGIVSQSFYERHFKKPRVKTFREYFGSWNEALTKAGLFVSEKKVYEEDEIINSLKKFYLEYKNDFSSESYFKSNFKPHLVTIFSYFGTWENACKAANIDLEVVKLNKREEFLNSLIICKERYGSVSVSIYKKSGLKPSVQTFYRHFGSWKNALKEAGIE